MSETRQRILESIQTHAKALLFGLAALVATTVGVCLGADEEQVLEGLCTQPGLHELATASELCTHGPDPTEAFPAAARPRDFSPTPAKKLCPGNGTSGPRVQVLTGPADDARTVYAALGTTQRLLSWSSATTEQRIRFLCVGDTKPTLDWVTVPWEESGHFGTYVRTLRARGQDDPQRVYLYVGNVPNYPYCGQANIGVQKVDGSYRESDHPGYAMVKCRSGDLMMHATLHELAHVFGAVAPEAPRSSGDGWHCHDDRDALCYNDGGSYFAQGGTMQDFGRCTDVVTPLVGRPPLVLDCHHDDYYAPGGVPVPWNLADSRFLTRI